MLEPDRLARDAEVRFCERARRHELQQLSFTVSTILVLEIWYNRVVVSGWSSRQVEMALGLRTAHDRVYEKLRELIVGGVLSAGERLDERGLADALGVSRTPVREAVTRLVSDGLVEHRPYQGSLIRRLDVDEVSHLYDVRAAIEALTAKEAASRLTPEGLGRIRLALNTACVALEAGELTAFAEADRTFHRLVAECSENGMAVRMLDNLDAQIQLVRTVANRDTEFVRRTLTERAEILEAFEERDGIRAAKLMVRHINDAKRAVVGQLQGDSAETVGSSIVEPGAT